MSVYFNNNAKMLYRMLIRTVIYKNKLLKDCVKTDDKKITHSILPVN